MLYTRQITVDPLTPIEEPVSETIQLTKGSINLITVLFPPGCCCLVGIWIEYHTIQILPWERNQRLFGAGSTFSFEVNIPIDTEPFEIILYGYSEDDTYSHTVYINVNIKDIEPLPIATFSEVSP